MLTVTQHHLRFSLHAYPPVPKLQCQQSRSSPLHSLPSRAAIRLQHQSHRADPATRAKCTPTNPSFTLPFPCLLANPILLQLNSTAPPTSPSLAAKVPKAFPSTNSSQKPMKGLRRGRSRCLSVLLKVDLLKADLSCSGKLRRRRSLA